MRIAIVLVATLLALPVASVRSDNPPPAKGQPGPLTNRELSGIWRGEKDGTKIEIVFRGDDQAQWIVTPGGTTIVADLKRVEDKESGTVGLRFDSVAKPSGTFLGRLGRGGKGALELTVLPAATEIVAEYKPVERIPLSKVKD